PQGQPDLGELHLGKLVDRVSGRDVADLVAHDAGELGFRAHVVDEAAGDVDVAAGQREGVDGGVVDDGEGPRQVGALGARGELAAESLDVALQLAVVVKTELLHHRL